MEVGFLYALVGGVLSILSPCSALLVPAFFAHVVARPARLWVMGLAYLAGTLSTLVPLGLAVGWAGSALAIDRLLLIRIAGWVVMALGGWLAFGGGFALTPGVSRPRAGLPGAYLLGLAAGVSSFCTGPILGSILTLTLTGGSPVLGGALLAVYGVGLAVPVVALAALIRGRGGVPRWLRGRMITVAGLRLHTTSLVAGLVTVLVGAVLAFNPAILAGVGLDATVDGVAAWARSVDRMISPGVWAALAVLVTGGIWLGWLSRRRTRPPVPERPTSPR